MSYDTEGEREKINFDDDDNVVTYASNPMYERSRKSDNQNLKGQSKFDLNQIGTIIHDKNEKNSKDKIAVKDFNDSENDSEYDDEYHSSSDDENNDNKNNEKLITKSKNNNNNDVVNYDDDDDENDSDVLQDSFNDDVSSFYPEDLDNKTKNQSGIEVQGLTHEQGQRTMRMDTIINPMYVPCVRSFFCRNFPSILILFLLSSLYLFYFPFLIISTFILHYLKFLFHNFLFYFFIIPYFLFPGILLKKLFNRNNFPVKKWFLIN